MIRLVFKLSYIVRQCGPFRAPLKLSGKLGTGPKRINIVPYCTKQHALYYTKVTERIVCFIFDCISCSRDNTQCYKLRHGNDSARTAICGVRAPVHHPLASGIADLTSGIWSRVRQKEMHNKERCILIVSPGVQLSELRCFRHNLYSKRVFYT
ncbi:hypothetical protein J6590_031461 [Homalodisca vitripennis]|nr:hypothetical protein J6590_031461 [Homalodisca vitripennis]